MKKASIVSIGNELLNGQTLSTNTAYLGEKLLSIGIPVVSSYIVSDDVDSIVRSFNLASEDGDVIIATGGLGPTDDDLTRQGLAVFLGTDLQFHDELLQKIKYFFTSRNRQMTEKNKVQAYIPLGTQAIANNLGTAPGIMAEKDDKMIVALPGVPSEMRQMFEGSVLPELKKQTRSQFIVTRKLKCFGTGESNVAEMLGAIMQRQRNPLVNCTVHYGMITLTIIAASEDKETADKMAEQDEKLLRDKLGDLIYGTGDQTLAEVVGEMLVRQGKTVAVAESCTGGIVAKLLTDVPGASRYFKYGWITYSNGAKTTELGVSEELIEKNGAVSEQVAQAMAKGARCRAEADFAIAITGIAGPTGATEQKKVGLVYISVESAEKSENKRFIFSHGRELIRLRAAQTALNMLRMML